MRQTENTWVIDELYHEPENCKRQKHDYEELLKTFSSFFGHSNAIFFSSPGRTEIGGNHTDHNHGRVLAAAVDLDMIAAAAKNESEVVRIVSEGYSPFKVDMHVLSPQAEEKNTAAALVRGILSRMAASDMQIGGFDICINGRVPKGSGLSSSASFEVLIATVVSHLFNKGAVDPVQKALIGQYAENIFFGKPCGLMDQMACAVGGFISIDFKDPLVPVVEKIDFDLGSTGYSLVITDTGGDHAHLGAEYASLPSEMKSVARHFGAGTLRQVSLQQIVSAAPELRAITGDRAILRAFHFQNENQRVLKQAEALERNDFRAFLDLVIASGHSSFMYNQNIFTAQHSMEQSVALGLAFSEMVLTEQGAWRVHGGGFAGTIQAFVPDSLLAKYIATLEHLFGKGACLNLDVREMGACRVEI